VNRATSIFAYIASASQVKVEVEIVWITRIKISFLWKKIEVPFKVLKTLPIKILRNLLRFSNYNFILKSIRLYSTYAMALFKEKLITYTYLYRGFYS